MKSYGISSLTPKAVKLQGLWVQTLNVFVYSILFCSILFYSNLFYSILYQVAAIREFAPGLFYEAGGVPELDPGYQQTGTKTFKMRYLGGIKKKPVL